MLFLSFTNLFCATSIILLLAPSPMALGALILTLALQLSLILSMIMSSWFALLLFLIYIGGLLVMFSYFIALSPNMPMQMKSSLFILISTTILLYIITPKIPLIAWPLAPHTPPHIPTILLTQNLPLMLFLATILFFALILVVKISHRTSGPLRPFTPPVYA